MTASVALDSEFIRGWLAVLDTVSYYELFGIPEQATADDVRHAFHKFAFSFHPDQHRERPLRERSSIDAIFKRGNEAFLVLSDPFLRAHYDKELKTSASPPRLAQLPKSRPPSQGPKRLEDAVRSPNAKPFVRRAEELVAAGDFRQAKLQMVLATHMDEGNDELATYLKFIESKLGRRS